MLSKSQKLYDEFAPYYRNYSQEKIAYLDSIDKIIINEVKKCNSLLDVGSADGIRACEIARKLKVKKMVLIDNSKKMAKICRRNIEKGKIEVEFWLKDITDDDAVNNKNRFEVITCLWNVLGHVEDRVKREVAIRNMKALLARDGIIFLDVNNRYNISSYKFPRVIRNIMKDIFSPSDKNGDFEFKFQIGSKEIPASVHIFNPLEIERLIKKCGLKIIKRFYFNYKTGKQCRTIFEGQLLYKIAKNSP